MTVIEFPNKQPFHEFVKDIQDKYKKGLIRNFVCIFSSDYEKEEEKPFIARNSSYWFAKNTTECLGSLKLVEQQILDFVREMNRRQGEG